MESEWIKTKDVLSMRYISKRALTKAVNKGIVKRRRYSYRGLLCGYEYSLQDILTLNCKLRAEIAPDNSYDARKWDCKYYGKCLDKQAKKKSNCWGGLCYACDKFETYSPTLAQIKDDAEACKRLIARCV